jgi:hypothetical protein
MRFGTKLSTLLALLVLAAGYCTGNSQVIDNDSKQQQWPTTFNIEYVYQLEVNGSSPDSPDDVASALEDINERMVVSLQESISNTSTSTEDARLPNVQYNSIASEFTSHCFTESDTCRWIKSAIDLSHMKGISVNTIERVTINLVQNFLKAYSQINEQAVATYIYPMIVSGWGRFQIEPVSSTNISDMEIQVLEKTFLDVFGDVIAAFDGDTTAYESQFYENAYKTLSNQSAFGNVATEISNVLSTDVQFYGKCRNCSDEAFTLLVSNIIESTLDPFQKALMINGRVANSTYFNSVHTISYGEIMLPDFLPPIDDFSAFHSQSQQKSYATSWYLWVTAFLALVIIGVGLCLIRREYRRWVMFEKEDPSTCESDSSRGHSSDNEDFDSKADSKAIDESNTPNGTSIVSYIEVAEYTIDDQTKSEVSVYEWCG